MSFMGTNIDYVLKAIAVEVTFFFLMKALKAGFFFNMRKAAVCIEITGFIH